MTVKLLTAAAAAILMGWGAGTAQSDTIDDVEGARAKDRAGYYLTESDDDTLQRYGSNDDDAQAGYGYDDDDDDGDDDQPYGYGSDVSVGVGPGGVEVDD